MCRTCVCVTCYTRVVDVHALQELVSRYEHETDEHRDHQDACTAFCAWLRATREQFTTCCDIYGDKVTIMAKLDRTKVCLMTSVV